MKKQIPSHKHKASDIVETADDYLLPHLRSLRDPSKIERTIISGSEPVPEGSEFPTEPYDYQLFKLTQDFNGYVKGIYRYNSALADWFHILDVEIGFVDIGLPIYDPTHYLDDRAEEGWNDWSEGTTFKEPAYALSIYRLTLIAVGAKFLNEAQEGSQLEIKIEYSFNAGVNWYQFGTTIIVTSSDWAEYTRADEIVGDLNQQLWVRFMYRVGQTGEGSVHGYVRDCELRTRYKKTRWEMV